jgi:hypothetical protein
MLVARFSMSLDTMESLPVLHPPLQGALERTPVLILLLLLQVFQQGGWCQVRMALQQRA